MSRRFVCWYDDEHDLTHAVRRARDAGWRIVDVHTPCPVHGLDQAIGLRPSRLPWACLLFGAFGAVGMMWLQHWTSAVDWRLNVGGRPWNSSLSFACVAFEVMVLCAGLGSVMVLLAVARLYPGRVAWSPGPRVTDDRFALVIEETDQPLSADAVADRLAGCRPLSVEEVTP